MRLHLGLAFHLKGRIDDAIGEYREGIRIDPTDPELHYNLGIALRSKGLLTESIASYREAIALRAEYAEAHCNLGLALVRDGQIAAGLDELRRGHEIGSRDPAWKYGSARWVADTEQLLKKEEQLLAIASGKILVKDGQDLLLFARFAHTTKRWRLSVRLFEEGFASDPALTDTPEQWPLQAAHAAVAAASATDDWARPDERPRLRGLALGWMEAQARALRDRVESGDMDEAKLREAFAEWKADPELAPLREATRLAQLPPGEAQAWTAFWAGLR